MAVPEGSAYIAGLNAHNAEKLLAIAEKQGLSSGDILTTGNGFHVPVAVADEFSKGTDKPKQDKRKPDPFSLEPPVTTGTPNWTENTVAPDEQTLEVSTPFTEAAKNPPLDSSAQTGVGTDTQPADEPAEEATSDEPAGNSSQVDWLDFAKTTSDWDSDDEELSRNDLREKYGSK